MNYEEEAMRYQLQEENELQYIDPAALASLSNSTTPTSFYGGKMKEEGLGKWEVDFGEIIESLIMTWRGFSYDRKTRSYNKNKFSVPMMNERGINDVMGILQTHLHKGIVLSKLKDHERDARMRSLCLSTVDLLDTNFQAYEIPNYATLKVVLHDIETLGLSMFNRAVNGWEAENRIKMISISNSNSNNSMGAGQPRKKFSWLGKMWGGE